MTIGGSRGNFCGESILQNQLKETLEKRYDLYLRKNNVMSVSRRYKEMYFTISSGNYYFFI